MKMKRELTKDTSSDGGCTGNPGTCRQCQMDPMSTLFCTTVASRVQNQIPFLQQDNQYQEQTLKHQYRLIL